MHLVVVAPHHRSRPFDASRPREADPLHDEHRRPPPEVEQRRSGRVRRPDPVGLVGGVDHQAVRVPQVLVERAMGTDGIDDTLPQLRGDPRLLVGDRPVIGAPDTPVSMSPRTTATLKWLTRCCVTELR